MQRQGGKSMKTKKTNTIVCTNVILSEEAEIQANFTAKFAQAINYSERNKSIRDRVGRTIKQP